MNVERKGTLLGEISLRIDSGQQFQLDSHEACLLAAHGMFAESLLRRSRSNFITEERGLARASVRDEYKSCIYRAVTVHICLPRLLSASKIGLCSFISSLGTYTELSKQTILNISGHTWFVAGMMLQVRVWIMTFGNIINEIGRSLSHSRALYVKFRWIQGRLSKRCSCTF